MRGKVSVEHAWCEPCRWLEAEGFISFGFSLFSVNDASSNGVASSSTPPSIATNSECQFARLWVSVTEQLELAGGWDHV